jgi:cytoskeletal protein CcmA (bactofilin family)
MFKRSTTQQPAVNPPIERVTSVLGPGINWKGNLRGSGGVRIEGAFEARSAFAG